MPTMKKALVSPSCVACGACTKVCPTKAISVHKGLRAVVKPALCVGCGKCAIACPAHVITIQEVQRHETAVV